MNLTVTQNITKFNIVVSQSNIEVKLQPILNTASGGITIETDPIFLASEASNFVDGDKANLDNQSGINTGDETIITIQAKRPLKTINNNSIEGAGNLDLITGVQSVVAGTNVNKTIFFFEEIALLAA